MRKHYIDNLRFVTVLSVLIYHVFYLYNGVGILGNIPNSPNIPLFDALASVVYPWFMVLLFVLAGMSARYSLDRRSWSLFLKSRAVKLIIPSTLGLFCLHFITGYLNIKLGGGLELMPSFLVYPISVISGIGPLWFIQMLFLFSCVIVILKKLDKNDKLWELCGRSGLTVVIMLVWAIWGASFILNLPVLTMYRFGIYFLAFLIGYYIFSHDEVQNLIERNALLFAVSAVIFGGIYLYRFIGQNFTADQCLQSPITNVYLWFSVLALIGGFKRFFDFKNRFTEYMSKSSFGVYIVHYPVMMSIGYGLTFLNLPAWANYLILGASGIVLSYAVYEVIRRIPVYRYFVLGVKKPYSASRLPL